MKCIFSVISRACELKTLCIAAARQIKQFKQLIVRPAKVLFFKNGFKITVRLSNWLELKNFSRHTSRWHHMTVLSL